MQKRTEPVPGLQVDREAAVTAVFPELEGFGIARIVVFRALSADDAFRVARPEYEDVGVVGIGAAERAFIAVSGGTRGVFVHRRIGAGRGTAKQDREKQREEVNNRESA